MSRHRSYQAFVHLPSHNVDAWLDSMTVELLERTLSDSTSTSDLDSISNGAIPGMVIIYQIKLPGQLGDS